MPTTTVAVRVLLLVLLLPLLVNPAPSLARDERLVLAFYYAWFDWSTWELELPDRPAQPYTSSDPATIERHVLQAQQAGIDGFVQSWYGPQVESNQTESNFAALLDVANRHGFSAGVDLEVTSPFIQSQADLVAALQHLLTVHARHRAYLRVGGRPIVFFWRQGRFPVAAWEAIRSQVDPQRMSIWIMEGVDLDYLEVFDGNHLYSVAWDPAPEGTLVRWAQRIREWDAAHDAIRYWVATVMPGYDDRATGRPDAFVRDRAGGEYYRRGWEGAIRSAADWVIITSFNEWMEGSQIEPSVGYADSYLHLTRELADTYRASEPLPPDLPAAPIIVHPTDTPLPSPTVTPQPPPSPTAPPVFTATATPPPAATPLPTSTPRPATATVTPRPIPAVAASPTPPPASVPGPRPALPQRAEDLSLTWPGLLAAGLAASLLLALVRRRLRH